MHRHHHHLYSVLERVYHHAHHLHHGEMGPVAHHHHGRRLNHKFLRAHHALMHVREEGEHHALTIHGSQHHHGHAALRKAHAAPSRPVEHAFTPAEVHQAIHQAADTFGVSPNLLGGIAYLESNGGNPNAKDGQSLGLFQMQHTTSNNVMRHFGDKIAGSLEATDQAAGTDKYKDMIADLRAHREPSLDHYNKLVLDAHFNALLGAGNTRLNAEAYRIKPDVAHLTDLYSVHLSGRHIGANDQRPLSQIMVADHIAANTGVLGVSAQNPDPTGAQAYAHMSGWLKGHLDHFTGQDKALGLYKADPTPPVAHAAHGHGASGHGGHHSGGHHTGGQQHHAGHRHAAPHHGMALQPPM